MTAKMQKGKAARQPKPFDDGDEDDMKKPGSGLRGAAVAPAKKFRAGMPPMKGMHK
jgi:hypothetical protein